MAAVSESNPENFAADESDSYDNLPAKPGMLTPAVGDTKINSGNDETLSREPHYDMLRVRVDAKEEAEFDYVRDVLDLSGFSKNEEALGMWHSDDQPLDPLVFTELETFFHKPDCSGSKDSKNCSHHLLFDLINQVLMEIYERSYSYYPVPLSPVCHIRPVPVGYHVLEEVWALVSWYLTYKPEADPSLEYDISGDVEKRERWMNLQYDSECVGLELENLIFEELLEEMTGL